MSKEIMQRALDALETIPAGGADLNQLALTVAGVTLALRAALAEPAAPQGEPVAWLYQHGETGRTRIVMPDQVFTNGPNQWLMVGPLYAAPPAAPSVPASPQRTVTKLLPRKLPEDNDDTPPAAPSGEEEK
jgi:hypothetical protein